MEKEWAAHHRNHLNRSTNMATQENSEITEPKQWSTVKRLLEIDMGWKQHKLRREQRTCSTMITITRITEIGRLRERERAKMMKREKLTTKQNGTAQKKERNKNKRWTQKALNRQQHFVPQHEQMHLNEKLFSTKYGPMHIIHVDENRRSVIIDSACWIVKCLSESKW